MKSERFAAQFHSEERVNFIAFHCRCAGCGQGTLPNHNHHVKTRGAGGTYLDIVALCPSCHAEIHNSGRQTFERRWKVDLVEKAALTQRVWEDWGYEGGLDD